MVPLIGFSVSFYALILLSCDLDGHIDPQLLKYET